MAGPEGKGHRKEAKTKTAQSGVQKHVQRAAFQEQMGESLGIFLGLKFGVFQWEKLPKEVQDAVEDYIEHKFDINLDDYPPAKSESG